MFSNKKVLILGNARSGYEAAKVLRSLNSTVILNDLKEEKFHDQEKIKELRDLGCKLIFGNHPDDLLDNSFDYLIKNPGVSPKHKYVIKANELNIKVINEVEMAFLLLPSNVTFISITGTNGKTTTTTLIYEIIKASGKRVHLTGNIGYPLSSFLKDIKEKDIIVMETSCQQLVNLYKFHPNICVMTNLSEAHIDFLENYENYKKTKARVYQNMDMNDYLILNRDNKDLFDMTKDVNTTNKEYFSSNNQTLCSYHDNYIYYQDKPFIDVRDIILKGNHNYENIMASVIVSKHLKIDDDIIINTIKNFKGVCHRLEFVREANGIKYYNDSKATNIKSTEIALSSFNSPIILIMGGMERNQDFHQLDDKMNYVKQIVCYGENKLRIKDFAESLNIPVIVCDNLIGSLEEIKKIAKDGDTVLLSPASASWDQYKCFEERGIEFKMEVLKYE